MSVVRYLHDAQPQILQDAAVKVTRQLIGVDPDTMWLMLSQLSLPEAHQVTPPGLKPYKFPIHSEADKYSKNVDSLLPLTLLSGL